MTSLLSYKGTEHHLWKKNLMKLKTETFMGILRLQKEACKCQWMMEFPHNHKGTIFLPYFSLMHFYMCRVSLRNLNIILLIFLHQRLVQNIKIKEPVIFMLSRFHAFIFTQWTEQFKRMFKLAFSFPALSSEDWNSFWKLDFVRAKITEINSGITN